MRTVGKAEGTSPSALACGHKTRAQIDGAVLLPGLSYVGIHLPASHLLLGCEGDQQAMEQKVRVTNGSSLQCRKSAKAVISWVATRDE